MNITDYIKGFAKSFGKGRVQEEIDCTRDDLTKHTLEFLTTNHRWLASNERDLVSKYYLESRDELIQGFSRSGYLRPTNPFTMLEQSLTNAVKILDFIDGWLNKTITEEQLSGTAMSLSKANVLQFLDAIGFASRYTRNWLDVVFSAESNNHNKIAETAELTPAQIKFLSENQSAWTRVISLLATPVHEIERLINDIPEIVVSEANPKLLAATQGVQKTDPFRFGFVQSRWNPIWLAVVISSDWQATRYKTAREEKEMLELRLLRLQKQLQANGGNDPRLSSIIEKRTAQLDKKRGQLAKMERTIYAESH